jgi:ribosomal protein S18 acetylase RimI-like enzyme
MQPYERAWDFDRELQERGARRVKRFDRGAALYNHSLPRVYDGNFIRIDDADGLGADGAERLGDSLQAELRHRKLVLPAAAEALAEELAARGWSRTRIATMEYRGEREPPAKGAAEIVDARAIRGAREAALADRDDDLTRQIAEYTERLAAANGGRIFAAFDGGEPGAFCALYERDGVGAIDEVTTIGRFRGRGLGNAVVNAALRTSLADGADLTFLNADADDWPKQWYERLGFVEVGRRYEVWRVRE